MTTQEAADELGIHRSRVLHFIREGRLKATKHGRDWWIEETDLDAVRERKNGRPKSRLIE